MFESFQCADLTHMYSFQCFILVAVTANEFSTSFMSITDNRKIVYF